MHLPLYVGNTAILCWFMSKKIKQKIVRKTDIESVFENFIFKMVWSGKHKAAKKHYNAMRANKVIPIWLWPQFPTLVHWIGNYNCKPSSAADGKGYGGDHRTSNIYICHHAWIHSWYPPLKGSGWWHAEIWVRTWPGPLEVSIFVQHNFSRFCQCWWMSYTW